MVAQITTLEAGGRGGLSLCRFRLCNVDPEYANLLHSTRLLHWGMISHDPEIFWLPEAALQRRVHYIKTVLVLLLVWLPWMWGKLWDRVKGVGYET